MDKFICLSFLFGLVSLVSIGQTFPVSGEMDEAYYVVIGVYNDSHEDLAVSFADSKESQVGYHTPKKRYYVYTLATGNFREAVAEMRTARQNIHPEAWVFVCTPVAKVEITANNSPAQHSQGKNAPAANNGTSTDEQSAQEGSVIDAVEPVQTPEAEISELEEVINNDTYVAFLLSNARNNAEVSGDVQIIDTERARLNDVVPSGEVVVLDDPENGTGKITAIADVFGYRKQQLELEYTRLFDNENVNKLSDYYVIFFDLVRYHKGDIATMYNVYFFNDAAVMRPESRYEVNSLLSMMRENPAYKIRIHGHTNGSRSGKIIRRTDGDPFYALAGSNRESVGSARVLSRERAAVIRDYLISEGIEPDRMDIKAWGGSRMLYDKNSSQAKKNVRVEIEIVEE